MNTIKDAHGRCAHHLCHADLRYDQPHTPECPHSTQARVKRRHSAPTMIALSVNWQTVVGSTG